MRRFVSAKIHGITVTDKSVDYHGSVSICSELLKIAGIDEYEAVDVVNLSNGARWTTYALRAESGQFTLNGGGARLGEIGDRCVILTYQLARAFPGALAVYVDQRNRRLDVIPYERASPRGTV